MRALPWGLILGEAAILWLDTGQVHQVPRSLLQSDMHCLHLLKDRRAEIHETAINCTDLLSLAHFPVVPRTVAPPHDGITCHESNRSSKVDIIVVVDLRRTLSASYSTSPPATQPDTQPLVSSLTLRLEAS